MEKTTFLSLGMNFGVESNCYTQFNFPFQSHGAHVTYFYC